MKDKIGLAITKWLMPYITNDYKKRGDTMKEYMDYDRYCLTENYLWFLGKEDLLSDFYNTQRSTYITYDPRESYYYRTGSDVRKVHSGLPSLISYSKLRLLNNGNIISSVLRKNETEDPSKTQALEDILNDNNFTEIFKKSILTESWGKKFAWKISYDPEVSTYPILTMYNPLEYTTVCKYGRIQQIIFINKLENGKYELDEEYGKGYIDYFLYQIKDDGAKIPATLNELDETKDLKRIDFVNNKDLIAAGEKSNDKGDYDGLIGEFDALDEIWSQLMDEIRLARSEIYVPENLLTAKTFDKFRKNYPELAPDMKENGKNEITHIQPDIRSNEYSNAIKILINNIITDDGLSPFTLGIDDGVGANASGDSLSKREANSLRTRDDMVKTWEPFLKDMFQKLLMTNDIFNKKAIQEYNVKVNFEDYITPSREEIIAQTTALKGADIIDTEKALDDVYGDMLSEEEKARILANTGNESFAEEQTSQEDNQNSEDNQNNNE